MKLAQIYYEVAVDVPTQKAWEVLSSYGDIASFHPRVKSSQAINDSPARAELGADRECVIPNGRKDITICEKITDFRDGESYTYDVYSWVNFPLKRMHNTFGVKAGKTGKAVIYQRTQFRLNPGFLTGIMKGKLRSGARDTLIAYKHFMETGERKADMKMLKKRYKSH